MQDNYWSRSASRLGIFGLVQLAVFSLAAYTMAAPPQNSDVQVGESVEAQAVGSNQRAQSNSQQNDVQALQGKWTFEFYYSDWWPERITHPPLTRANWRWLVSGNRIHWSGLSVDDVDLSFTVDTKKSPRQIDLTFLNGPHQGKTLRGIYKISSKDAYEICFADPAAKARRPTDFSYSTGEGHTMFLVKRVTPKSPAEQR